MAGGRVVADRPTRETTKDELAEVMAGRAVERPERPPARPGAVLLEADDLHLAVKGDTALRGVDLRLHAGQTLGIIGVSGNRQTTHAGVVSGLYPPDQGRCRDCRRSRSWARCCSTRPHPPISRPRWSRRSPGVSTGPRSPWPWG